MTTDTPPLGRRVSLRERLYFLVVGGYLSAVMLWLLARGKLDPGVSLRKSIAATLRGRRARGELADVEPEQGACFLAPMPPELISDVDGLSRVRLLEDGRPLGPAHCAHDEIRALGTGRFSHWGESLYFSSSDGSDPRTNGRRYTWDESA